MARRWERRGPYSVMVGKPEGKKAIWKTKAQEEEQYSDRFSKICWEDLDSFELAQDKYESLTLVYAVTNLQKP